MNDGTGFHGFLTVIINIIVAAAAGLIGVITGHAVHGTKIESLEERAAEDRAEWKSELVGINAKLDRLIERQPWRESER